MSSAPRSAAGGPSIGDLVDYQLFAERGYPHEAWTWLRRNDPVRWFEGNARFEGFWAITRHADIVEIGKDPGRFIVGPRLAVFDREVPPPEEIARHLLTMDPPEHVKYRQLASKWFTPRTVKIWQPKIERITRRVLDAAADKRELDFVAEVSAPITIAVIGLMLGIPEADWPLLFRWTNEATAPQEPEFRRGRSVRETSDEARHELFGYFAALAEERRKEPREDIVSVIASGKIDGEPLPTLELLSYYFLLVIAGNETTRNAMTGGVQELIDHPDQREKLRADASLVDGMVEETVRWVTPVIHIGFGRGEHVCLGAHLARLELRTLFAQLRKRLVWIERAGPVERMNSSFVGGVKRGRIRWELRDAARA